MKETVAVSDGLFFYIGEIKKEPPLFATAPDIVFWTYAG